MANILLVDDEREMLESTGEILLALGHQCELVTSGHRAMELLDENQFDLILCDLFMPEVDGMQVLERARETAPNTPFIILTAYGTIERSVVAVKAGAFDFLEKPFEVDQLRIAIEKGLRQRNLFKEKKSLLEQLETKYSFDNIVGKSPAMLKVFEMIKAVATTDANVIITGESGTGKELVARSIHARSPRKTKPFMPVNCGALPENLFESELFGYEKGAFTGALRSKPGLFELANGGTFFLDEVCELSEQVQVKLLRALQERKILRLGGKQYTDINVRIISATNFDIEKAIQKNKLREDFYYRLNVIKIHLPALRERQRDIPLLAEHFLRLAKKTSTKPISGFTDEVMERLICYHWPGNVREIQNVIERAVTLAKGEKITVADLPQQFKPERPEDEKYHPRTLEDVKKQAVEQALRLYLLSLLEKYRGNVTNMAVEAGMTRRNMHRLLKQYDFQADSWRKDIRI